MEGDRKKEAREGDRKKEERGRNENKNFKLKLSHDPIALNYLDIILALGIIS